MKRVMPMREVPQGWVCYDRKSYNFLYKTAQLLS